MALQCTKCDYKSYFKWLSGNVTLCLLWSLCISKEMSASEVESIRDDDCKNCPIHFGK